ncbi:hypothetical protein C7H19_06240 [Aphanothece hegewaldii CCALA 016]|uniref:Uncharacterized protein n=1 Tax=Aphanothece hegewaldii CCALA 016 TaxID=2107694 RepID=A0A2T1M057_9CHRO|nr:hypothetical protein [Aphanothece hegewaldii]PSF38068.1 hypothetical protein C7H19_06240 [Aphanothece hegewaldii CCALA 016]
MLRLLSFLLLFSVFNPISASVSEPMKTQIIAQCQRQDKPIIKSLRFARGSIGTTIQDKIAVCTTHDYLFSARAGQKIDVRLLTGDQTSFTVYSPSQLIYEADGVQSWSGRLPETGEYRLVIGTDVTANYTLEVTIR